MRTPTTDAQALKHRCPDCGAEPGAPCTYMPLKHVPAKYETRRITQEKRARVGAPTKRVHNGRRDVAITRPRSSRRKVVGPSPAVLAVKAYDQQEFEAMRAFLARDGAILWT